MASAKLTVSWLTAYFSSMCRWVDVGIYTSWQEIPKTSENHRLLVSLTTWLMTVSSHTVTGINRSVWGALGITCDSCGRCLGYTFSPLSTSSTCNMAM